MGWGAGTKVPSGCPSLRLVMRRASVRRVAMRVSRVGASSSVGQSTRLISVGSEVQVLPGPFRFAPLVSIEIRWRRARRRAMGPGDAKALPALSVSGCPGLKYGGLAQLVEHLLCKQGVSGSNPLASMVACGC